MGFFDFVSDAFDSIGDAISETVDVIGDIASGTADVIGDVASGTVDVIGDIASGTVDVIGDIASGTADVIGDIASGTADVIGDVASGTVDVIGDIASGTADVIGDAVSDAASFIVENPGKTTAALLTTAAIIATKGKLGIPGGPGGPGGVLQDGPIGPVGDPPWRGPWVGPLGGPLGGSLGGSVVDSYFGTEVTPIEGCVVWCKLGLIAEHSGIYIGNGKIVHLDGSGAIESVSKKEFLARLGGMNPAISVYVSCSGKNPVGNREAAERAESMIGRSRDYNFILDNCHQFSSGCITGNFDNSDNFLWMLQVTAQNYYKADSWIAWG